MDNLKRKSYEKPHRVGYQALANAIIERAADDYRAALWVLRRPEPVNPSSEEIVTRYRAGLTKKDVETFFVSRWFGKLTRVDGAYLMRRLRGERRRG